MTADPAYPTVLIVYEDGKFRDVLTLKLKQKGYLVLMAQDASEAFEIVTHHSRHIQLLLADDSYDSRAMAATLKQYRTDMNVIHIGTSVQFRSILREVSKALKPPSRPE
jgi:CheY-like chemotaxis protein